MLGTHKMAKRANPFLEDFVPQSKVHVGLKQFKNNDDRLKKVYEKTLDLLYKGAKKILAEDTSNDSHVISIQKDKMKQLFIGRDGALLHSGNLVTSNTKAKKCGCGGKVESQCAYCDTVLCCPCQHGCARCDNTYCTRCILVGSEGSEVCVSCYG